MTNKYYFYYNVAGRICSAVNGENITEITSAGEVINRASSLYILDKCQ